MKQFTQRQWFRFCLAAMSASLSSGRPNLQSFAKATRAWLERVLRKFDTAVTCNGVPTTLIATNCSPLNAGPAYGSMAGNGPTFVLSQHSLVTG